MERRRHRQGHYGYVPRRCLLHCHCRCWCISNESNHDSLTHSHCSILYRKSYYFFPSRPALNLHRPREMRHKNDESLHSLGDYFGSEIKISVFGGYLSSHFCAERADKKITGPSKIQGESFIHFPRLIIHNYICQQKWTHGKATR